MDTKVTPAEFFEKYGIEVVRTERGLLGRPTDKLIPMEDVILLDKIPKTTAPEELKGTYFTCFCPDEMSLMCAITTASCVADYLEAERREAGHI